MHPLSLLFPRDCEVTKNIYLSNVGALQTEFHIEVYDDYKYYKGLIVDLPRIVPIFLCIRYPVL